MTTEAVAHPFLKWAGGKRQILDKLLAFMPEQMGTYYEPFVGGGALFFSLAAGKQFQRAVLNDANQELMGCYEAIQSCPEDVIQRLKGWEVDKETFLKVRAMMPSDLLPHVRGARMIYLNKTGFNGLYRVNKKGEFNVPFGKWKGGHTPKVLDATNLRACSKVLDSVTLCCRDFHEAVSGAGPGDVVYFDPPYVPVSATSNFQSYTSDGFTLDDQHRLVASFRELAQRGVTVIASNSDTEVTRSLYKGFELHEIQGKRCINSKGGKRGPVGELIIVGTKKS
jgi:DNA adenine methylase